MTVAEDLFATFEILGGSPMSEGAAKLFYAELARYPEPAIHEALSRCRIECRGRLTLADVVDRIDDGRPGAEEAWSLIPKNEADSAAITDEMREAMFIVMPLIRIGDLVAARMAYVEAYRRINGQARAAYIPVRWQLTLGHDKAGRELAELELARRLGHEQRPMIEGPQGQVDVTPIRQIINQLAERKSINRIAEQDAALEAADLAHAEGKRCATGCEKCWPADDSANDYES